MSVPLSRRLRTSAEGLRSDESDTMDRSAIENPYLAHRKDLDGSKKQSHALDGVIQRKITSAQATKAMVRPTLHSRGSVLSIES